MKKFEYKITKHPSDNFKHVGFFCTDQGECSLEQLPENQLSDLVDILNENGGQGWEFVQLNFGRDGVIVFWKKEM